MQSRFKVDRTEVRILDIPTIRPHKLSFGSISRQSPVIVQVWLDGGATGFGEAATIGGPSWNEESPESILHAISNYLAPALVGQNAGGFEAALARIGGEDFVVLLPGADAATAMALVQRLLGHLAAQPVLFEGARIVCMASAGIASLDQNKPGDLNTLMRQAGTALRAAKAKGRNRVECAAPANGETAAALAC